MWYPNDGSEEWLSRSDAELCIKLALLSNPKCTIAEIGVWKGAWTSVLLKNVVDSVVIGVDPYPNCIEEKEVMVERINRLKLEKRFSLFKSIDEIPRSFSFDLVHVDGLHTEQQVYQDLSKISQRLNDWGIMIVDDYNDYWFPGVQSGLYKFIHEGKFRIFLVSPQKAYITTKNHAPKLWELLYSLKNDFKYSSIYKNWADAYPMYRYLQESDVLGQPILICSPK
jgi:hypothetical protein